LAGYRSPSWSELRSFFQAAVEEEGAGQPAATPRSS
jgi:hypothetical protein